MLNTYLFPKWIPILVAIIDAPNEVCCLYIKYTFAYITLFITQIKIIVFNISPPNSFIKYLIFFFLSSTKYVFAHNNFALIWIYKFYTVERYLWEQLLSFCTKLRRWEEGGRLRQFNDANKHFIFIAEKKTPDDVQKLFIQYTIQIYSAVQTGCFRLHRIRNVIYTNICI